MTKPAVSEVAPTLARVERLISRAFVFTVTTAAAEEEATVPLDTTTT